MNNRSPFTFFRRAPHGSKAKHDDADRRAHAALTPERLAHCSNADARAMLPLASARHLMALPLMRTAAGPSSFVTCAVDEACAHSSQTQAVKFAIGQEVRLIPVAGATLLRAIEIAYQGDEAQLATHLEALQRHEPAEKTSLLTPRQVDIRDSKGDSSQFLAALIEYALAKGASDLHFIPRIDGGHVRIRIDGRLKSTANAICNKTRHNQLVRRIKVLAKLDTAQVEKPLDGSFSVQTLTRSANIRVGVMPTIHGERAVLRFLGCGQTRTLSELNLTPEIHDLVHDALTAEEGALIVVGATGSGKTTTLYAAMRECIDRDCNVVSVEDPVEIELPGASQTSINGARDLTYTECLKALLRHDPDVIMVGEMRDRDSAMVALQAALTGHLLLSTLHARDVFEAFLRLNYLGIDWLTAAQAIRLLIAQQLIPTLCHKCQVVDLEESKNLGFDSFRPVGCSLCDYTGFLDRVVVAEALKITPTLEAELIAGRIGRSHLLGYVTPENYIPMKPQVERLLRDGRISAEQFRQYR